MAVMDVAKILRPHSNWGAQAGFDAQKLETLGSIIADLPTPPAPTDRDILIETTIEAVEDLVYFIDLRTQPARDHLAKFAAASGALADAWRCLGHHLQQSLLTHSDGRLGFTQPATRADAIVAGYDRARMIKRMG